jgi:thioredoxin reductase
MSYDAIVVGGSYAGLSAAIHLARARRRVLVVDGARPRNRFSDHSHGVLAQDGRPGGEMLDAARAQVGAYPTATLRTGLAAAAHPHQAGFAVELDDGTSVQGRGLILATGVTDILPDTPGLAERWGKTVLHCPYCHGYEIGGGSIGVLATGPLSVHQASLVADWGEVTLFTDDKVALDDAAAALLARRRVTVERAPVTGLEGATPELDGVRLADGRRVPVRALFVATRIRMTSPLPEQLGCAFDDTPLGPIVRTDMWKQTTVAGVFAAGDMARVPHSISYACADGVTAGVGLHKWLVDDVSARAAS